jgi:hypothetical protein
MGHGLMGLSLAVTGLEELTGILGNLGAAASAAGSASVAVGSDSPVAGYIERGTRPHTIRARNARVLAFETSGGTVFARSVNHPGTKANPVLGNALTGSEAGITELVNDAFTVVATGGPISAVAEAFRLAGDLVVTAAKAHAPVRTGAYRDSITARYTGHP